MDDRISVIVPVYQVEKQLPRCVDSLLSQTYPNLQIVLVDDGSPDRCGDICDAYAAAHENVRVVHKKNGGLSDARNAGIEHADGEYLMFVDSDDWIEPDMAEKLYRALRDAGADLSICNFQYDCTAVPDETENYPNDLPVPDGVTSGREILTEKVFVGFGACYTIVCNKLYSGKLFDRVRFPVGKLNEDEFVFHEILLQCDRVACVHDALYHYVIRPGSIMRSAFYIRRLDGAEAFLRRAQVYQNLGFPKQTVAATLERSVYVLNLIYGSAQHWKDKACRRRYRELLRLFRRLAPSCFFAPSVPRNVRVFLFVKCVAPHWSWMLAHGKEAR